MAQRNQNKSEKQLLKEAEKTLSQMIKSNDKLRKELDRMKVLMNYVRGSSEKK